jgi:CubicO group peptidase (beta-lactamase class C family)
VLFARRDLRNAAQLFINGVGVRSADRSQGMRRSRTGSKPPPASVWPRRSFGLLAVATLGSAATACGLAPPPASLSARLDRRLRANGESHGIPAQSVVVMRNGALLYEALLGHADLETGRRHVAHDLFPVHSVAKLFANVLVLELVDAGRLDLSAPIGRYVGDLPSAWGAVPVIALLNHVSGIPEYFEALTDAPSAPATLTDLWAGLAAKPLYFPAHSDSRYTQTNFLLIAALLERAHGETYRSIVTRRILSRLRLDNTYLGHARAPRDRVVTAYRAENGRVVRDWLIPWRDYAIVHADVYSTARDLGAFLSAVAQGAFARPQTLLDAWRPSRLSTGQRSIWAAGWDYGEAGPYREVGHDGGTTVRVRILFRENLQDHHVIVYLTNGNRDGVWSRTLVDSVQQVVVPDAR